MVEGTAKRLCDLCRELRRSIVRQSVVLPATVSEFGLQEKLVASSDARAVGSGQSLSHTCFAVMLALVRGIYATKSCAKRKFGQGRGSLFFPGGAVEEIRKLDGHRAIVTFSGGWDCMGRIQLHIRSINGNSPGIHRMLVNGYSEPAHLSRMRA